MKKASTVCNACGEDNEPNSEFCINCGSSMEPNGDKTSGKQESQNYKYKQWKKGLPGIIGVSVFLIFIDLLTSPGLAWAYWAVVPLLIFAVLVPYMTFKMEA